ncbi:MAG: AzlC family ABC transporter permease [Peptococcaceae bacterium]|nr:AzlC family ABC transporter permease [Peptococcaceae bacterium]
MGLTVGLNPFEIIMMSVLVFAGVAQFIAITMIGSGIAFWGIVLTSLLVNLRYLLMGASLAPFTLKQSFPSQALLSFLLTDESYALTISRATKEGYSFVYHLWVSLPIYIVWILSTIAGVILGNYISDPLAWGLDFAMPATFMVLLFPLLKDRISFMVCGASALAAVLGSMFLPGKWYIIVSCLLATILGGILEGEKK